VSRHSIILQRKERKKGKLARRTALSQRQSRLHHLPFHDAHVKHGEKRRASAVGGDQYLSYRALTHLKKKRDERLNSREQRTGSTFFPGKLELRQKGGAW